jgi:hypothetical protein
MVFATDVKVWRSAWPIIDSAKSLVRIFSRFDSAGSTVDLIGFWWGCRLARIMQLTRSLLGERMVGRSRIDDIFKVQILVY